MANTPSNMIPLGTSAKDFVLRDTVSDKVLSLNDMRGEKGTVILFICNHCPFVIHVNQELTRMANEYVNLGISFVAISSNDIEKYPQDGPELMKENAKSNGYPFPYLFDENQEVARAYDAACTPDTYLFDKNMQLVYRGQIDDSRPGNGKPVNGSDLRKAMNFLLYDKGLVNPQKPSMGCGIKWK